MDATSDPEALMSEFSGFKVPGDITKAPEEMGTKEKFWFKPPELGKCLFKLARLETGEDWSEKIAAEL